VKLKAIEMQGFKSFPDKTKMTFEGGITSIIGPNGSGKSNISDAIRWVLGEMSVKSLRGSKMEDVIFNGTEKRPPANFAAVSLYLDTAAEYSFAKDGGEGAQAPLMAKISLSDEDVFVITRRFYRTGESEYFINKKQVRLKDLYELFYDTGIGREGYSVIGQGKIAEVLSVKGDERRNIFEEAAGISKYRFKKTEAEKKLKETALNLERVGDILTEVNSRVEPLFKESENAKKYIVLSKEKKELEITICLEKADILRESLKSSEKNLTISKLELDNSTDEVSEIEKSEELFTLGGYSLMQKKASIESDLSQISGLSSEISKQNAVLQNEVKHFNEKITSLRQENPANDEINAEQQRQRDELKEKIASCLVELKNLETSLAKSEESLKENVWLLQREEEKKEKLSGLLRENENAALKTLQSLASLESLAASLEKSAFTVSEQAVNSETRLDEYRKKSKTLTEEEALLSEKTSKLKGETAEWEGFLAQKDGETLKSKNALNMLKIQKTAISEKLSHLSRLNELFEGYSESVKYVMRAFAKGEILSSAGKSSLRGTVASLFTADSDNALAIETSLGASAQFIVADSEIHAKQVIEHLKTTGKGRVTILPLDTIKGRKYDPSKIKDERGFVGVASDLVKSDEKYKRIAEELLGRTIIANDMETGFSIAKKTSFTVRVVTKDGQVINTGGSFTGGSPPKKTGLLTRNADIDVLENQIRDIDAQISKEEENIAKIQSEAEKVKAKLVEIKSLIERYETSRRNVREKIFETNAICAEEEKRLLSLKAQLAAGGDEKTKTLLQIEDEKAKKTSLDGEKQKTLTLLEQSSASQKALLGKEEELKTHINSLKIEVASQNAYLFSQTEKEKELGVLIEARREKAGRDGELLELLLKNLAESEKTIAENEKLLASYCEESEKLEEKLARASDEIDEREKLIPQRRAALKEAQIRKEQAFITYTRLENSQSSARAEYDGLLRTLWDEYELTYSTAVSHRLPPGETDKMPSRLNSVKNKIRALGLINARAIEEYEETVKRRDFLQSQSDDLIAAGKKLDGEILKLEKTMVQTFKTTFDKVSEKFGGVFAELFGGGSARLELSDPALPLECGIDIIIRPPGKSIKSISLLSGGEQSFSAIALYLALQEINPSPFCVFDEIEASLDEVNQAKLMDYIRNHCEKTQYILITHRRSTMEKSDVLYGITMREKGVSEHLRLELDAIGEKIDEYTNAG